MWKRIVAVLLLVMVTLAVLTLVRRPEATPVETVTVTSGDLIATLDLSGKLINDRTVTITALLDGEITSIGVREGEQAEADQQLAALDERQPGAMLDRARAELIREELNVAAAAASHERLERMARDVSSQALADSRLALDSAEAAVNVAKASVRVSELQLENAVVRAPFAGTVTTREAEVGQWVEAGTRLFTLVAADAGVIEADVDATDFERVRLGQRATLASASNPERSWTSVVEWIAPAISDDDNRGTMFTIRIAPGDDAPAMLIGQPLDVDLEIERRDDVPFLPLAALRGIDGSSATALSIADGVATAIRVELGLVTAESAEILSGLERDAVVIMPFGDEPGIGERVQAAAH